MLNGYLFMAAVASSLVGGVREQSVVNEPNERSLLLYITKVHRRNHKSLPLYLILSGMSAVRIFSDLREGVPNGFLH